ncbi:MULTISPECIES: hypothetical protein [unclassified Devosia]|uniref:hypothetical protein n=1 Tax=unclassified Devosia TaxID=196773 RepID=UPI001ACDBC1A|nr:MULTISPECIES: hypothetical protein [unclassified Devosia]MBN9360694.1 hypothetical protein [Devosia sp.]
MPYPDLPVSVKTDLASMSMREHHHMWHLARNPDFWNSLTPQEKADLTAQGWNAPRFHGTSGSGLDFLGMHRNMIPHVNHLMAQAGDPSWPSVVAWMPIPWSESDADWPMPPSWPGMHPSMGEAKSPASVSDNQQAVAQLTDPAVLKQVSLDALGRYIEGTIHAWMHNRWSAQPVADVWAPEPENDYLGAPFSSHVNKHFWKLHGWIDERIRDWERANDRQADLSDAWSGPSMHTLQPMAEALGARVRAAKAFIFAVDRRALTELLAIPRG